MISDFSAALSPSAEMIAPACPMRRPFGAVSPATYPTTGLVMFSRTHLAASALLRAADLADHDHGLGLRILLEQPQMIQEGTAVDGIPADADAGGDADAERLHLRARFVAQGSGTGDDAHAAARVDVARHDAEHRFAGADDARAIRPDDGGALSFGYRRR